MKIKSKMEVLLKMDMYKNKLTNKQLNSEQPLGFWEPIFTEMGGIVQFDCHRGNQISYGALHCSLKVVGWKYCCDWVLYDTVW